MNSNIPKIIHQIWLGPKEPPQWCIDSWKINYINENPEWLYKLWTEKEIENLDLLNKSIYDKEPTYRGKSDIARYEILYKEGGIFLDADSLWINNKSLDHILNDLPKKLPTKDILFGANEPTANNHLIANGVIGCNKGNSIMFSLIQYLKNSYIDNKLKYARDYDIWLVTGPVPFNKIIKPFLDTKSKCLHIVPSYYFFPEKFVKGNIYMTKEEIEGKFPNSYMYQYWLSHYN